MNQVSELRRFDASIDYRSDADRVRKFLFFYEEDDELTYLIKLRKMEDNIEINVEDIALYDESGLVERIEKNAMSYIELFYKVIDDLLYNSEEIPVSGEDKDMFLHHRISRFREKFPDKKITDIFPAFLLRQYTLSFVPRRGAEILSVRRLKSAIIGSLVNVSGIVMKIGQVKPNIKVVTYVCESCGAETYQQISGDVFDLLEECGSEKCRMKNVRGPLILVTKGSKFVKYQTVHVQELMGDVPQGRIPRTLLVECYSSATGRCKPGDVVIIGGVFMQKPYYGLKKVRAGLLVDTYFYAMSIEITKAEVFDENAEIRKYPIHQIVKSIAPEIFGMEDVKKALLLALVGAPSKKGEDGIRIRGDINILLTGDSGIAKSQLLKTCTRISRRGIYTTGKGSSGVGLTASVSKDPITGEMVLDGGALVLADGGVCCIDELDKMNEIDRVSIHEVMEQQSVSVSKAGINTVLNARCCVISAANPIRGKYDVRHSMEYNSGLPCALLSRFDIIAVLRDEPDASKDKNLADHVIAIHLCESQDSIPYSEIRAVIDRAKKVTPILPKRLSKKLVDAYVKARKESLYVTPRYLVSLVRLSLAHSRLRLSEEVNEEDIDEVLRLMEAMRIPFMGEKRDDVSGKRAIYDFIVSLAVEDREGRNHVKLADIWSAIGGRYTVNEVEDVISDFLACGMWTRDNEELIMFN